MAFGIGSAIKRTLGSAANKVADKIIPKELAPFLPLLAPAFMGPGAGIMSRYLVPQLLTALSSGKTAGDISGTGQVLTGLGSLLSDPSRMAYSDATKTTSDIVREGPITTPDPVLSPDDLMTVGPDTGPVTGTDLPVTRIGTNTISTAAKPINYDFAASDKNFLDYLKRGVNESRDFMQGTNVANMPMGDEITVGDQSKLIGRPKVDIYDPAYQSAVRDRSALTFDFGKDNALQATGAQATGGTYGVGDDVLVRDAGFFQNLPRRAVAQGIQSIGPASTAIDKYKADQDAEAARLAEEQAAYSNSVADLINYYRSLTDPDERFGSYNQGGRVNKNIGGILRALAKPAGKAFNKLKTKLSRMTDDVEIYGSSDFADDTGAAFSATVVPKTKKGLRELNKLVGLMSIDWFRFINHLIRPSLSIE